VEKKEPQSESAFERNRLRMMWRKKNHG